MVAPLIGGTPSSVTRMVMRLVPGVCAAVGRQENRPLAELIVAPVGAPGSRLKIRACGGASASIADAVNTNNWLSITTQSARLPGTGAVFEVAKKLAALGVGVVRR